MKTRRWRETAAARGKAAGTMWTALLGFALCVSLIVLHGLAPGDFTVDSISVSLVVVALIVLMLPQIPTLGRYLTRLRLPGVEAEFRELTATAVRRAEKLVEAPVGEKTLEVKEFFHVVEEATVESDPNVRIAAAAIELERKLREVLERAGIDVPRRRMHLRGMSEILWRRNTLSDDQMALIRDVAGLRNQAVHGATVTTAEASSFERVVATLLASIRDE